jgi:pantothenate kinase-related protein Tda10
LTNAIHEYRLNEGSRPLEYPVKCDGEEWNLDDLKDDQRQVVARVLEKLKEWIEYVDNYDPESSADFQPLRLTIVGAAGSGKSVIIDILVMMIRKIFQRNDTVFVGAPTGT